MKTSKPPVYPLSSGQRNIWDSEQLKFGAPENNICYRIKINGRFDKEILEKCVLLALKEDSALRIRLAGGDESPICPNYPNQYFVDHTVTGERLPFFDFTFADTYTNTKTGLPDFSVWEREKAEETFPLYDSPLYYFAIFRTAENEGGLFIKFHHLISDGWSTGLFINRLQLRYNALLGGTEPDIKAPADYAVHLANERRYFESEAFASDGRYWKERLQNFDGGCAAIKRSPAGLFGEGRRRSLPLPDTLNREIERFCKKERRGPFSLFFAALAVYLDRVSGGQNISVGVPVLNRLNFSDKNSGGMFVSTLPFFCAVEPEQSAAELCDQINEDWYDLLRRQRYPFGEIQKIAKETAAFKDRRLFDIVLSYQEVALFRNNLPEAVFSGEWVYQGYQNEELIIHITSFESGFSYNINYDYLPAVYSAEDISDLHRCLVNILSHILDCPGDAARSVPLTDREQAERLIYDFNRTDAPVPQKTLPELFDGAVRGREDKTALICGERSLTFFQTRRHALTLAAKICKIQPERTKGRAVAICLERGAGLAVSMLAASYSGNAWVILPPSLPAARLSEIIKLSRAEILVTDGRASPAIDATKLESNINIINIDDSDPEYRDDSAESLFINLTPPSPDDLAYIVFTSGTTGTPKGVEITHLSLCSFAAAMKPYFKGGGVISICDTGFDVFVMESVVALACGCPVVMPREDEKDNPEKLAALIEKNGADYIAAPPSKLRALTGGAGFRRALKHIKTFVCGGEAISAEFIRTLRSHSGGDIYNQYGPSEATIGVSLKKLEDGEIITAGKPMANCRLYVLDENLNPMPAETEGELYIGGLCVGRGYRGESELTRRAFIDSPFIPGERLYRSGDFARFTREGEVIIGGRRDNQVKLRGLRIEPEEITRRLLGCPGVTDAAVKVIKEGDAGFIAAYYTSDRGDISEIELISCAASTLPSYMIPSYWRRVDAMPLNRNGKIDRSALPAPEIKSSADKNGRALTKTESAVLSVFRSLLNKKEMGADDDYFLFGGDSLTAIRALTEIESATGASLKISDFYAFRSAARLASFIDRPAAEAERDGALTPQSREYYPLSPIQQSMYFQSSLNKSSLVYNMPGAFLMEKEPDIPCLEEAFRSLIASEDIFRTYFVTSDIPSEAGARQVIADGVPFELNIIEADSFGQAAKLFVAPFELSRPPLLRAALWKRDSAESGASGNWIMFIDTHHIINDGIGTPQIFERLGAFYSGASPSPRELTYKDYVCSLFFENAEPKKTKALEWWKNALAGVGEPLELPCDRPRPDIFDFKGGSVDFAFNGELTGLIENAARRSGTTPFAWLAGFFGILLSKVSGQRDFLVGTPVSERSAPQTRDMLGPLINTLPVRMRYGEGETAESFIKNIACNTAAILDHSRVSYEELLKITGYGSGRSLGQSSLYSVIFTMRPDSAVSLTLGGGALEYIPVDTGVAKVDLTLEAYKESGVYKFRLEYASSLFDAETIEFYARCYALIAKSVSANADIEISEFDACPAGERSCIIKGETAPFEEECLDISADRRAARNPDGTAVIYRGNAYTWAEFLRRTDGIAGQLQAAGFKRGDCAAVMCSRSPELIYAVFGIMKAGGAYMPLTSSVPELRMARMLKTAGAEFILCDAESVKSLPESLKTASDRIRTIVIGSEYHPFTREKGREMADTAQILFTSGSTGEPKGVVITHRSLANLCSRLIEYYEECAVTGEVLCSSSFMFDSFTVEVLIPIAAGRSVVMADEYEISQPWTLASVINASRAKLLFSTPSRLRVFLADRGFAGSLQSIRMIMSGGEALDGQLASNILDSCGGSTYNMYGPAETTAFVTSHLIKRGVKPNIGRPIKNCRIYILDEKLRPVLPTAAGEIYISGDCLASGYCGSRELTERSFIPDPFCGGIMYRTGDLARLLAGGEIEYLGRGDGQVKLNGQRVELSEINGLLSALPGAADSAVIAVDSPEGGKTLRAFIVGEEGETPDISYMRKKLSEKLPAYMIPSDFYIIEAIPRTVTGKNDSRALASLTAAPLHRAGEPRSETIIKPEPDGVLFKLLGLWKETLGKNENEVDPSVSFFSQGGTSLGALSLIVGYYKNGWRFELEDFYANKTAAAQAAVIKARLASSGDKTGNKEDGETILSPEKADAAENIKIERNEKADAAENIKKEKNEKAVLTAFIPAAHLTRGGAVLITGATGFLGSHIAYETVRAGKKAFCLVRGGAEKLYSALAYYHGGDWVKENAALIEAVTGDITLPGLGLSFGVSGADFKNRTDAISLVIHAAADVRHYMSGSEAETANIAGTRNVIEFAEKSGAALHYISTVSVAGDRIKEKSWMKEKSAAFCETDRDIGQNWEENAYVRSKFIAEGEVIDAAAGGLEARIFRVGRLVGRNSDGKFQRNSETNYFCSLVRAIRRAGCMPKRLAEAPAELTAVDLCTRAILLLGGSSRFISHIFNPNFIKFIDLFKAARTVTEEEFASALLSAQKEDTAGSRDLGIAVDALLKTGKAESIPVRPSCAITAKELSKLGFTWPIPDPETLLREF